MYTVHNRVLKLTAQLMPVSEQDTRTARLEVRRGDRWHSADALAACDQAMRFRRIVKCVARHHGMDATFLAKPYADMAGSGLHLHVSLLDAEGRNVFADENPLGSATMRHAAAGLLDTMAEGMAIFAPLANSWRRLRSEAPVKTGLRRNWFDAPPTLRK